jgi:putative oxidoreductase
LTAGKEDTMREAFLVGRILVGGYYVWSGINHFAKLDALTRYADARGVPLPALAVAVSGLLLLIAGLTFLLGVYPRVGVIAAALFLIPVTLMMHQFWNVTGGARAAELANFTKNLALLGSSLMFLLIPEPWPYSVLTRGRLPRRLTT